MNRWSVALAACIAIGVSAHAQVTLPGGIVVPKERFIIYIVVGNSEAEGQTTVRSNDPLRPLWDETHPRLWNFNVEDNNNPGPHHTWVPARGKNHAGTLAAYPDWLGPEMPLLKELVEQYSEEYYFGVLKVANQGDRLRKQYLNDELGWGEEHQWTQITDAIAAIGPNTVTWGGMFTVFCDMEIHDVIMGYADAPPRLDSLAHDIVTLTQRARVATNSELPLLFACPPGTYFTCIDEGRRDVWDRLNTQLSLIPTLDSRAVSIPVWWGDTSYVLQEFVDPSNGHYSGKALARLAEETVGIIRTNGYVPPLGNDTQPPTAPTGLSASGVGPVSLTLSWTASTDDVGVSSYTVYRDGDSAAATAATSVVVSGLSPLTAYTFTVRARDFSGKVSALSAPLQVSTAEPGADGEAPTVPQNLRAESVGLTGATLAWNASTDNVGVAVYVVFQDGYAVDTVNTTQATVSGLLQQTMYVFTVRARDAAGNESASSAALTVTTGTPVAFPFRVNVGGPAANGYLADREWDGQGYGYTGSTGATEGSGDVTGTADDSVYHFLRYGADLGYRVAVPNGSYNVTLMFAEYWWDAGNRVFTPFVNGEATVAQPIDVAAAVGFRAAFTVEASVEVSSGLIDITFTHEGGDGSGNVPILNGILVENAAAYVLLGPTDQSQYCVGDTLAVRWLSNTALVTGTDIYVSADGGEGWLLVNTEGTVFVHDPRWGDYPFVIPEQLGDVSLIGVPLTLKLSGYNSSYSTEMQGTFTVLSGLSNTPGVSGARQPVPAVRAAGDGGIVVSGIPRGERATLEVHALNGALVRRWVIERNGAVPSFETTRSWGARVVVLRVAGGQHTALLAAR